MDSDYYRDHLVLQGHLESNTYSKVKGDCDTKVMKNLKDHIETHKSCLTVKEIDFLTKFKWTTSNFYVLPKVHKCISIINKVKSSTEDYIELQPPQDLKGRPIVGGCEAPTQRLSALIEKLLSPIATKVKTYIKDDWHFLRLLPATLDYNATTLYSVDISSLYTSITHDLGVEAIQYWINKHRNLIPSRFNNDFIIHSLLFVLKNNNFTFDDVYYHQNNGTAMGTKLAPPYACLVVGFLEETKLFPKILPNHFIPEQCRWIEENFKRYMDDGFAALLKSINITTLLKCLNSLHPNITFTEEKAIFTIIDKQKTQMLNFLDVNVLLRENNQLETDVYYKTTNSHDYLNYDSSHPEHIKRNIPYNLAKRIICFVSNHDRMEYRLKELKSFLSKCNYPINVIEKGIFNAKLQGPAPEPKKKENILPLVTTNYANFDFKNVIHKANFLFQNTPDIDLKDKFSNFNLLLSQRQPKNLLQHLSSSKFKSVKNTVTTPPGISKCKDIRCKICKLYLQTDTSFQTSSGKIWHVKCNMSCKSTNAIYFLKCNRCDGKVTYIGKTNNVRLRTNQHISECRTGVGTDIFDKHVHHCNGKPLQEPYFKLYLLLTLKDVQMLLTYEKHFQQLGFDTMNR